MGDRYFDYHTGRSSSAKAGDRSSSGHFLKFFVPFGSHFKKFLLQEKSPELRNGEWKGEKVGSPAF